jgi:hypothetical protein
LDKRWFWLWSHLLVDYGQLSVLTGLARAEAAKQLEICAALRMVYPDGSISDLAQQCVNAEDGE